MFQPPKVLSCLGEVTGSFFNTSRRNKSSQYFETVDEKNNVTFNISEQFKTFQSLQEKMSLNRMEHFVKLWIRDSRPTSAAQQGSVKRKLSEEIRFYELICASIHGGKKFKPRIKGARQTALVVLLILYSFKNHAKVKIASTSSH